MADKQTTEQVNSMLTAYEFLNQKGISFCVQAECKELQLLVLGDMLKLASLLDAKLTDPEKIKSHFYPYRIEFKEKYMGWRIFCVFNKEEAIENGLYL